MFVSGLIAHFQEAGSSDTLGFYLKCNDREIEPDSSLNISSS